MKTRSIASRAFLAGLALVSGLAMTTPSWAANGGGKDLKICVKILGLRQCIKL